MKLTFTLLRFRSRLDELFGQIEREFEHLYAENLTREYMFRLIGLLSVQYILLCKITLIHTCTVQPVL